jgi:5'-3' exonuclease
MGIEKFFTTVNRNFSIMNTVDLNNIDSDKISGNHLMLDFNSIIHNASSRLISRLISSLLINKNNIKPNIDIDLLVIKEVNSFIINLLQKIELKNLESVYCALDGVPTFSKMLEQKKRRFMGDLVEKLLSKYNLPINWSKNNITPGTIFMDKMSKFLNNIKNISRNKPIKEYILDKNDYEFYKNIKNFEVSDIYESGEGEMKIIDKLELMNNKKILFYSPDSDVILLSMISNKSDFIDVLKYNQDTNDISIIDIKLLKTTIYNYCLERINGSELKVINIKKLIKDIVFIFTVFGNDFLPRCEAIQTNYDFLFLIDIYLINLINKGHILSESDIINVSFLSYLNLLRSHEKRLLFRNSYQNIYQNYNYANQINFILDLRKLKNKFEENIVSKKFGEPFYNFYNNILFYIDPIIIKDIIEKNRNPNEKYYGSLQFYVFDKEKLIRIIYDSLKSLNSEFILLNGIVNINNEINNQTNYERLIFKNFKSNIKKHIVNMKDLNSREKEMYLIENKLDKYYQLFNPISEFYIRIQKTRQIDESYYYKKYFNNHSNEEVVREYLKGFRWIFDYYFNRNKKIDEYWYYPYFKSPLFESLTKYYNMEIKFKPKKIDIKPLEQLLYITPITLNEIEKPDFYKLITENKNDKLIVKIKAFIEKHPEYFYNLDEIYLSLAKGNLTKNLLDCSHSSFIAKCHYEILNYVVNINQFIFQLRKYINQ